MVECINIDDKTYTKALEEIFGKEFIFPGVEYIEDGETVLYFYEDGWYCSSCKYDHWSYPHPPKCLLGRPYSAFRCEKYEGDEIFNLYRFIKRGDKYEYGGAVKSYGDVVLHKKLKESERNGLIRTYEQFKRTNKVFVKKKNKIKNDRDGNE